MTNLPTSMNNKHSHLESGSVPREITLVFTQEETLYPRDYRPSIASWFSPSVSVVQSLLTNTKDNSPAKSRI